MKFLTLPAEPVIRKSIIAACVVLAVVATVLLVSIRFLYFPIASLSEPVIIEVTAGSSLSRVSRELNEAGYLRYPQLFILLARWRGVENAIKTGEYELDAGTTPSLLLEKLVQGDALQYRVTLVEGWTFRQALAEIWQSEKIQINLRAASLSEISELLALDSSNPEGMLYPDTYFYTAGTSDLELLRRANATLNAVLELAWESRLGALPFENSYEALVLASIVEKESGLASERGHIAGVFIRRLEQGMRLQSDPTVIYGMGEIFGGDIRRTDLTAETPYNTYRIDGLPPTPIALAGFESISASLNPLPSDYLYFVAKGDGSHYFSSSLEEHNEAVNRFQRETEVQ